MPAKGTRPRFKPEYYVRIYELSREGLSYQQIATALGVTKMTLLNWRNDDEAVRDAIKKGRSPTTLTKGGKEVGETFSDFVYKRLPKKLRKIWNEMRAADREKNGEKKLELILRGRGTRTKQHLFAHAFVCSNFNAAEACRKIGLPYVTFDHWKKHDPDFLELMGYIQEMKKDFVEGCLMSLIQQGDSAATIFANRTLNRERGYDPKVIVEHRGTVLHGTLSLDGILNRLPVQTQREILKSIRQQKEPLQLEAHDDSSENEIPDLGEDNDQDEDFEFQAKDADPQA